MKKIKYNNRKVRQSLVAKALPDVKKLVNRYDLASVNSAVKALYEEKKADKELKDAEAKVAQLKSKLGK